MINLLLLTPLLAKYFQALSALSLAYVEEYKANGKDNPDDTFLGRFILAALSQKSMVTNKIYKSGNLLAGFSVDYARHGFGGIRDYFMLVNAGRRNRT